MIKTTYSADFEAFWADLNKIKTRTLGSKPEAYRACEALQVEDSDYEYLLTQYKLQKLQKERLKAMGIFEAEFPDICRWIKHRRFEDAPDERANSQIISRSDQRKREALTRYLEGDMGAGMAETDSPGASVGGGRLVNLRVLANKPK